MHRVVTLPMSVAVLLAACSSTPTDPGTPDYQRRLQASVAVAPSANPVVQWKGRAAARSLLGGEHRYDPVHSFWSDQYEHSIQYAGFAARWDRVVVRGGLESRRFLGFYLKDGIVRAVVGFNRGGDPEDPKGDGELKAAVNLVRHRAAVDPALLADEDVDLRRLVVAGGYA